MKTQFMFIKSITMTLAFSSVFVMLGCQKQEGVKIPDAAESADNAAQAAQAATDAASAAAPAVSDASVATAAANNAAVSAPIVMKAAS